LVTQTLPVPSTPVAASSIQASTTASALDGPGRPAEKPSTVGASPRASEPGQSGDPGYRGALYDLGVAMYRRGEEEQACGLWAQASEAGHAGAAYELGMVRLRRGDPVEAESWWRTAADRREPRAIAELADLLDQLGKHAEAKSWRAYAAEQHEADAVDQPTSR
jgi:TPR repeat protein